MCLFNEIYGNVENGAIFCSFQNKDVRNRPKNRKICHIVKVRIITIIFVVVAVVHTLSQTIEL